MVDTNTAALRDRRHFYRVTTRLRFRIRPGSRPGRAWIHTEPGMAPYFYRPTPEELEQAEAELEGVARRTINLSEGGMRVRFPEDEEEASLLRRGHHFRSPPVHILLALEGGEQRTLFQLPARQVRMERLPWAHFIAFEFVRLPEGLQRHLEAFVLAVERRRLRHPSPVAGPDAEEKAERLRRLEVAEGQRAAARRKTLRPKKRARFFP